MNKNLNYNYENRSVSRTTSVLANVEMVSCKKADLSRLKVTNDNFYHTTDTNEFFYDWGGKRNKLNVLGGDQNIQSEIDKIKDSVAKLDTKKMDSLEAKVNTAVQTVNGVKSDVADAVQKVNEASKTAQDAANAVTDKASKSDIDEAIAKIDLTGYAKKSEIPSLDNYATKDEIPSVEGFIKSGDLVDYAKKSDIPSLDGYATKDEIPSLDNYATKDEIPSVEGFIKSGDLVDYAKKSDIPSLDGYATKNEIPSLDDYAKKEDIPSVNGFIKSSDLDDYAKKSDIPSLDNYATKDEIPSVEGFLKAEDLSGYAKSEDIPSLDNYATKDEIPSVEGFIKSSDLDDYAKKSDIPSLDNYATKDEIPSVEGFLKAEDLTDYAKTKDIPNPLVKSVDDSEATQTKVQFGVDETGKLTGSIAAYDVDGVVQSKINDLNLDSKYAPAGSLDGKQDKLSADQLAALDKVNTLNLDGKQDTLANADVLSNITAEQVNAWNGKQDTLANADVLSKITAEEVNAWNGKQDTLANASVLSNITAEQVNAWNGKQDTITTVTLPTNSISDDWDGELSTLDQDGYVKANDLIKYVEAAIMKKKSDESAVVTEKNSYAYITGYSEGDKETDITVDNPFKLNPEGKTEIVFLTANEIGTFEAVHPDDITEPIKPVINVPTGYTLTEMSEFNAAGNKWDEVKTVCPNSRYATKTINGIVYNSYTRSPSSDMDLKGPTKYKITIKKD